MFNVLAIRFKNYLKISVFGFTNFCKYIVNTFGIWFLQPSLKTLGESKCLYRFNAYRLYRIPRSVHQLWLTRHLLKTLKHQHHPLPLLYDLNGCLTADAVLVRSLTPTKMTWRFQSLSLSCCCRGDLHLLLVSLDFYPSNPVGLVSFFFFFDKSINLFCVQPIENNQYSKNKLWIWNNLKSKCLMTWACSIVTFHKSLQTFTRHRTSHRGFESLTCFLTPCCQIGHWRNKKFLSAKGNPVVRELDFLIPRVKRSGLKCA